MVIEVWEHLFRFWFIQ